MHSAVARFRLYVISLDCFPPREHPTLWSLIPFREGELLLLSGNFRVISAPADHGEKDTCGHKRTGLNLSLLILGRLFSRTATELATLRNRMFCGTSGNGGTDGLMSQERLKREKEC